MPDQTPDEAAAREAFRDRLERTWDLLRELDRDENDPELYPNDPERDVSNYVAGLWTTLGRYGDVIRGEVWAALVGPSTERDSLRAEVERAHNRENALHELHAPDSERFCVECSRLRRPPIGWPCPTLRAAADAETPQEETRG